MTSFVHVDQPLHHPGVARAEAVIDQLRSARKSFDGARGLAALLLGAVVSAVLVVADRSSFNMADGGLLVGWIVLWGLAFIALALLADTARSLAVRAAAAWKRGAERRRPGPRRCAVHGLRPVRSARDARAASGVDAPEGAERSRSRTRASARRACHGFEGQMPSLYEATRRVRTSYYY